MLFIHVIVIDSISHVIVIICVISCFLFISYGSEIYFIPFIYLFIP